MMSLQTEIDGAAHQPSGPSSGDESLGERLEQFAAREPKRALYTFQQVDGVSSLTLQALDLRARAGARALADAGVRPGDRVLLLFPQGLDFIAAFMSCIYRGAIAVTAPFPTRPLARVLPRLRSIADDCRPALICSSFSASDGIARDILSQVDALGSVPWLAFAEVPAAAEQRRTPVDGATPAFLQYTSGSTAAPRGVVVSHKNLLDNCRSMRQPRESRLLSWLPQYHDFGLIYSILLPLIVEVDSVILPPGSFLQSPRRWLEAISHHRATHSPAPNFAFEMCVHRISKEQRANLDLSCWQAAIVGAEPIRGETLQRFLTAFAPCGVRRSLFIPAYGLAEATLLVTRREQEHELKRLDLAAVALPAGSLPAPSRSSLVSCGTPVPDMKVLIVDAISRVPCAEGVLGEIWIAGPSVSRGYFGRDAESDGTFRAQTHVGDGPYLRTGDLGVIREGELFVAGRSKEVIVVRGAKYYPQDIEHSAEHSHPALEPASVAAFGTTLEAGEAIVVTVELGRAALRDPGTVEIASAIRHAVARDHGVSLHAIDFVPRGALPKTTSGKIRRVECRARRENGTLELLVPAPAEIKSARATAEADRLLPDVAQLVTALLRRSPPPQVAADTRLGDIGLDSVMFAELGVELETRYGFTLPASELFSLSLGELARKLAAYAGKPGGHAWKPVALRAESSRERPPPVLIVESPPSSPAPAPGTRPHGLEFTLFSFGDLGAPASAAYELVLDGARVADRLGLTAIWLPERHFHPFGGISPNPSVLAAALTQVTKRLRIRAGSVILPLHNPIRVAEEWAVIDNLSGGRVDLAFGWGWNPNDFVLAPEHFAERKQITLSGIESIQALWRGGKARAENGSGAGCEFQVFPRPRQTELPVWLTCTQNPEAFITAGACGYNVLTALLFQSKDELASNIALYRAARAQNGHDPASGVVSLMLHTLLGSDRHAVRELVREPFKKYLYSSRTLWQQRSRDLDALDEQQRETTLGHAFERYFESAALFGTPSSALPLVSALSAVGVNEIACLFDFGVEASHVLAGLEQIDELRRLTQPALEVALAHAE